VFEGLAALRAFRPQQGRHHGGVAPDPHRLSGIFLARVDHIAATRLPEQVDLAEAPAVAGYQHEVLCEDAIHRRSIVFLHGQLVLRIQRGDGFGVLDGARGRQATKQQCRNQQANCAWISVRHGLPSRRVRRSNGRLASCPRVWT
jgi:hypothetical protein